MTFIVSKELERLKEYNYILMDNIKELKDDQKFKGTRITDLERRNSYLECEMSKNFTFFI